MILVVGLPVHHLDKLHRNRFVSLLQCEEAFPPLPAELQQRRCREWLKRPRRFRSTLPHLPRSPYHLRKVLHLQQRT